MGARWWAAAVSAAVAAVATAVTPARAIDPYPLAPWTIPTTGTVDRSFQPEDPAIPHEGIDIAGEPGLDRAPGNPVFAPQRGTVVLLMDACNAPAGPGTDNPNPASRVLIQHAEDGVWSLFSHMAEWESDDNRCGGTRSLILVSAGDAVDPSTQLGWQGNCCPNDNDGHLTHLHFQVNAKASPQAPTDRVDPTPFLTGWIWPGGAQHPIPPGTALAYNGPGRSTAPPPRSPAVTVQPDDAIPTETPVALRASPGSTLTFELAVKNAGTSTWRNAESYYLARHRDRGAALGAVDSLPLPEFGTAPGDTARFTLSLAAPPDPGVYEQVWQMARRGADGDRWFGAEVRVVLTVSG